MSTAPPRISFPPEHGAPVLAEAGAEGQRISRLLQDVEAPKNGLGAFHVEDAHRGIRNTHSLGGGNTVNGVEHHALSSVSGTGSRGGGQNHGFSLGGREHPTDGGYSQGKGIVQCHGSGNAFFLKSLLHGIRNILLAILGFDPFQLRSVRRLGTYHDHPNSRILLLGQKAASNHLLRAKFASRGEKPHGYPGSPTFGGIHDIPKYFTYQFFRIRHSFGPPLDLLARKVRGKFFQGLENDTLHVVLVTPEVLSAPVEFSMIKDAPSARLVSRARKRLPLPMIMAR